MIKTRGRHKQNRLDRLIREIEALPGGRDNAVLLLLECGHPVESLMTMAEARLHKKRKDFMTCYACQMIPTPVYR